MYIGTQLIFITNTSISDHIHNTNRSHIDQIQWNHISLQCPAAKTIEKHHLHKILTHIPFHPAQHGLRPKPSTCTALSTITTDIAASFSR